MNAKNYSTELNRIKHTLEDFDTLAFNKLYKACTPLIRRLSRQIDGRRLNLSQDIIESLFYDKFLFIFNKYYKDQEFEHLKASLLSGLKRYSYRLMRECYSKQAEFNQTFVSFDTLFDNDKGDEEDEVFDILDDNMNDSRNELLQTLENFLRQRLDENEYLLYTLILDPPPFLKVRIQESRGKLSILHLLDYFELPRDKNSYNYVNSMKNKVTQTLKEAEIEFNNKTSISTSR